MIVMLGVNASSGLARCLHHLASPYRQQARRRGHAMRHPAYSRVFYRQVNDALALAALIAFTVLILLVAP
jgi:hypothetical protein